MSGHVAVPKEADLMHAETAGKSVIDHLKLSVLEDALLNLDCALPAQRSARKDDRATLLPIRSATMDHQRIAIN